MYIRSAWVPNETVHLVRLEEDVEFIGNPQFRDAADEFLRSAHVPALLWELAGKPPGWSHRGVRDDNRSVLLTDSRVVIDDREFVACIKGCGSPLDAYEVAPLTADRLRVLCHDSNLRTRIPSDDGVAPGMLTGERWFGNVPYGGQAPDNALIGLTASLRAKGDSIAGFRICPVLGLVKLPEAFARIASSFYWYRQYHGEYWEEIRLMPSNVRLYFHSPITFGIDTGKALGLFEVESLEDAERFLRRMAGSALAALTLFARTLRADSSTGGYRGLGYHDVWLDKDAVIARDGTMHFADLEGIEDVPARDPAAVREMIASQFHRNVYEATYAFEALVIEVHRRFRVPGSFRRRRAWILELLEDAAHADPYVDVERQGEAITAHVAPAVDQGPCGVDLELANTEAT
ncbi:MAG TPA: hypothetical protein VEO20_02795 [Thermoplasmata archaeon]|nr:hypothetical protein [Thermoplasmata archaeon]